MDWKDYQSAVRNTAIYPDAGKGNAMAIMYCGLGAAGEAGEIANKIKKIYRDDDGVVTVERRAAIAKEIGGTFWYLAQLMNELNMRGEEILEQNISKLARRAATGTLSGDGDDREMTTGGPEHYVEVTENGIWLLAHRRCQFDRLVCPYTLAAQIARGGDPSFDALSPGHYSAALDERGELVLLESPRANWSRSTTHEVRARREGWALTFVPTRGRQAGNEITRTFWYDTKEEARVRCVQAYGEGTEIKCGERTDGKERFDNSF